MRPSPIQGLLVQTCDPSPPAPTHTSRCPSRSSGAQRVTPPTCHGTGLVALAFLARSGQFTRTEPLSTLRTGAGLGPPARRRGLTGGVGGRARVPVGTFLWPALAPPDPLASPTPQRCQVWGRGKVTKSLADERRQRGARQGAGDGRMSVWEAGRALEGPFGTCQFTLWLCVAVVAGTVGPAAAPVWAMIPDHITAVSAPSSRDTSSWL